MIIVLLGPPGSGKGTQAKVISAAHGIPQLSAGDILRAESASGSPTGFAIKALTDMGMLVPDHLIIEIISSRITQEDCAKGFILDGFPRTLNQANALDAMLAQNNLHVDYALNFQISSVEVIERISGRRICSGCTATYHLSKLPPAVANTCDDCGKALSQRSDDRAEVVQQRLNIYDTQTKPVADFYESRKVLHNIVADNSLQVVNYQIETILRGKQ
jgi:adenylate kinase